MLILTRKCNESIRIGDNITVTIMRIEPGQVRVGIDAPRGLPVHREEVYERILAENREAAQVAPAALTQLVQDLKGVGPARKPVADGESPNPAPPQTGQT